MRYLHQKALPRSSYLTLCVYPFRHGRMKTHIRASVSMVKVSAFVLAPPIGNSCQHAKLSANVPASLVLEGGTHATVFPHQCLACRQDFRPCACRLRIVENVRLELRLLIPNQVCYHYTTFSKCAAQPAPATNSRWSSPSFFKSTDWRASKRAD